MRLRLVNVLVAACVLAGCAYGTTSDVSIDNSATPPVRAGDVQADRAAIGVIGLVLEFGWVHGFANLGTGSAAPIDGISFAPGDVPSTGSNVVSVAVGPGREPEDFGLAVRSDSQTCLWYSMVSGAEHLGDGEPCTGARALANVADDIAADSPWRTLFESQDV